MLKLAVLSLAAATVAAKVYFKETFQTDPLTRWTEGTEWKASHEMGHFKWTGGKYPGQTGDKGIQTDVDYRYYSITAPLDESFDNLNKDLVVSYTVKMENDIECGGAYLKLLPGVANRKKFGGDSDYSIMFGPDICGYSTRKTHVILNYNGTNLLTKKSVKVETDKMSHRYTLVVRTDNTYEVLIDGSRVESGSLYTDFDFEKPKTIKDPSAKKPADWVDEAMMDDPEDVKPAGWDDTPAKIPDPSAKKPADWDDEEDGEWEAPLIDNPEYKGEWKAKRIPNPAYKGAWVHPEIPNPDYVHDPNVYHICHPCTDIGFELWQVRAGSLFDDIIVADSLADVEAFADETFNAKKAGEKAAFDAIEAEKKAKEEEERKKSQDAEAAKASAASHEDEDEDEDEDDKDEL